MAFDEGFAQRVREILAAEPGFSEKKMFGGLCFLINGNMCCGVVGEELMVRVGAEAYDEVLSRPHTREMDFTGKPLRGMVYVGTEGVAGDDDLASWIECGAAFARFLPPK